MPGKQFVQTNDSSIDYPILDSHLPFSEYIAKCRGIISERRADLTPGSMNASTIINANAPFELYPDHPIRTNGGIKYGILLIHGLLDCPFSVRDIGLSLQAKGMLCRAILLPGHGTQPSDLLHISYHDWMQAVRYGVETLKRDVEQIFLVGYSTGAALSLYQALQDNHIYGVVLLSPAIKIKAPVDIVVTWHRITKILSKNKWIYRKAESDYAKYQSIPFNPVTQLSKLTKVIFEVHEHRKLMSRILMVMSQEDETISSHEAINFFSSLSNQSSKLLLYTSSSHPYTDPRILTRHTDYSDLNINHFSHASIPFAPGNPHYGQHGDYADASHIDSNQIIYGAYNNIEEKIYDLLFDSGLIRERRRELTYNPDFDFMSEKVVKFILGE